MKLNSRIKKYTSAIGLTLIAALTLPLVGCNDGKSYSDMLREEEVAVNWYLAMNKVEVTIPADSVFVEGPDAPFYKMDGDGNVYMRIVNRGDMSNRPKLGETVYFRYMSLNIKNYYNGGSADAWTGNAWDMDSPLNGTNLIYGNKRLESTTQYGEGIQVPLAYVGYNSEVDVIIKSIKGFSGNISQCQPYIYKVRYFKAEY